MGFSRQEYWSGLPFPSSRVYGIGRPNLSCILAGKGSLSETLEVSNIPRLGVLGGFALTFYTWDLGRTFWCPDILGFSRGIWKWDGFG